MKKSILALTLAGALTLGGSILAFASDDAVTKSNDNSYKTTGVTRVQSLINEGKTFEEAKAEMLQVKFEKIDELVSKGTITKERGEEIKAQLKERSESCTTPGENKGENKGGYGLQLGKDGSKGPKDGTGKGCGRGNGGGKGTCQISQ